MPFRIIGLGAKKFDDGLGQLKFNDTLLFHVDYAKS